MFRKIQNGSSSSFDDKKKQVPAVINIMSFIHEKIMGYAKENHCCVEMSECACDPLSRDRVNSPRKAIDAAAVNYFTNQFPIQDGHNTLNLTFVGEGKMLYAAHLIGLLNQCGYNVKVTIIDQLYNCLSDDYVAIRTANVSKENKESAHRPHKIASDQSPEDFMDYLVSMRNALHQFKFVLSEFEKQFKVKNILLGHFYSMASYKAILANRAFYLFDTLNEKYSKTPYGQLPSTYPHEFAEVKAFTRDITGEFDKFELPYRELENKTVHGIFLIDISHHRSVVQHVVDSLPPGIKQQAAIFTLCAEDGIKVYRASVKYQAIDYGIDASEVAVSEMYDTSVLSPK